MKKYCLSLGITALLAISVARADVIVEEPEIDIEIPIKITTKKSEGREKSEDRDNNQEKADKSEKWEKWYCPPGWAKKGWC